MNTFLQLYPCYESNNSSLAPGNSENMLQTSLFPLFNQIVLFEILDVMLLKASVYYILESHAWTSFNHLFSAQYIVFPLLLILETGNSAIYNIRNQNHTTQQNLFLCESAWRMKDWDLWVVRIGCHWAGDDVLVDYTSLIESNVTQY